MKFVDDDDDDDDDYNISKYYSNNAIITCNCSVAVVDASSPGTNMAAVPAVGDAIICCVPPS